MGTARRGVDWLRVVEEAYRLDGTEDDWLRHLLRAAQPILYGSPEEAYALTYDARDPARLRVGTVVTRNTRPSITRARILRSFRVLTPADIERSFGRGTCGTASDMFGRPAAKRIGLARRGARDGDAFGVNALDPSALGCVLVGLLSVPRTLDAPTAAAWTRIAAHIAAARRLRKTLGGPLAGDPARYPAVDAVLTLAGKVEHASPRAARVSEREALVTAVRDIEGARRRDRHTTPGAALESWRSMVDAQWTLVHHFERDGKCYLVAVRNEAPLPAARAGGLKALTPRERQVVGFTLLGHSNKVAAYELGVADSTLRVLLARALKKLRLSSTADLVRLANGEANTARHA